MRAFIAAPTRYGTVPELATQHARRTALRVLYRTARRLTLTGGDPTLDVHLPPRGCRAARPLTDDEITLCRASALGACGTGASLRATAWALGEATAVSSEITAVRARDLDDPAHPRQVHLPGTRRHNPRTVDLTQWGSLILRQRATGLLANHDADVLLAYGGHAPPGGAKAQASVCNALRHVLASARLLREQDIRPASVRHWAGRSAYDNGSPIEEVARTLGLRSLDATADDIGLDWRIGTAQPATTADINTNSTSTADAGGQRSVTTTVTARTHRHLSPVHAKEERQ